MKILLITPYALYSKFRWLPLGLSYISSLLKKNNHEVRVYDRFLKGYRLGNKESVNKDMRSEILEFKPDIIGLTTISPLIHDTVTCVKYIRDFFDGIIIAGGHHATAMPQETLNKTDGLDYVAVGEAEYTILSLAEGKDPLNITGLFNRNSDNSSFSGAHIRNLDDLPFPDYRIFDMDYYTEANHNTVKGFYLRSGCILSSRGCPNNCKFCTESLTFGRGIRFHSPDYIIENIERLVSDYKVDGIYFHDNNFLASHSHAENICNRLIKSGLNKKIKWEMQTGTPTINDDILHLLSEAGCVKIELGIESIKDGDLEHMNKNASTDLNIEAMKLCHKNGVKVHTNFMTGFEGESLSDLNKTLEWIKMFKPHTFSFHRIQVYPGTELYEASGDKFFEKNEWTKDNVDKYFRNGKADNISQEERRKWFLETYRPFSVRYGRKATLKVNSIKNTIKMVYKKYFPQH
jgi:anaerobic magnesium-protoporphyrin IX monomethyl ester cyclase